MPEALVLMAVLAAVETLVAVEALVLTPKLLVLMPA